MNPKLTHLAKALLPLFMFAAHGAHAGTSYTTQGATSVTSTGATLTGTAASTCSVGNIRFSYGATAAYGFNASATPGTINTATQSVSAPVSSLVCNTTYHYKLTGDACLTTIDGADQTFTTAALGAPTSVTATMASTTSVGVSWSAPASDCGSPIASYTVQAVQDATKTCSTTGATSCTVTGLTTGTPYTFTVTAVNGNGIGDASVVSNSVTPALAQSITNFSSNPSTGTVGGTSNLTATPGASGNPVTFGSSTPTVCTVSGSTVTYLIAGTCTVTANEAGNGSYGPAPQLTLGIVSSVASGSSCFGMNGVPSNFNVAPCVFNLSSSSGAAVMNAIVSTMTNTMGLANVRNQSQASNGTVTVQFDTGKVAFMPVDVAPLDARANGLYAGTNGKYVVVNNGTAITIAPGILNFSELATLTPGWSIQVDENGTLTASNNGTIYSVKPAYFVETTGATGPTLGIGSDGLPRFVDSAGNSQILYPTFADPSSLQTFLRYEDASANATVQLDGSIAAYFKGQSLTLKPDLTLGPVPTANASGTFWNEAGNRYSMRLLNRLNTTQGFTMQ